MPATLFNKQSAAAAAAAEKKAEVKSKKIVAELINDEMKAIEDTVKVPNMEDGEIVRLHEFENDDENNMMRVTFKTKYTRSTDTPEEIVDAKKVFSSVFRRGTKFLPRKPQPPCDQDQYQILKKGLERRRETLKEDMANLGLKTGNPSTRQNEVFQHLSKLFNMMGTMIDVMDAKFSGNPRDCSAYYDGKILGNMSADEIADNDIREYYKTFSYLVLHRLYKNTPGVWTTADPELDDDSTRVFEILARRRGNRDWEGKFGALRGKYSDLNSIQGLNLSLIERYYLLDCEEAVLDRIDEVMREANTVFLPGDKLDFPSHGDWKGFLGAIKAALDKKNEGEIGAATAAAAAQAQADARTAAAAAFATAAAPGSRPPSPPASGTASPAASGRVLPPFSVGSSESGTPPASPPPPPPPPPPPSPKPAEKAAVDAEDEEEAGAAAGAGAVAAGPPRAPSPVGFRAAPAPAPPPPAPPPSPPPSPLAAPPPPPAAAPPPPPPPPAAAAPEEEEAPPPPPPPPAAAAPEEEEAPPPPPAAAAPEAPPPPPPPPAAAAPEEEEAPPPPPPPPPPAAAAPEAPAPLVAPALGSRPGSAHPPPPPGRPRSNPQTPEVQFTGALARAAAAAAAPAPAAEAQPPENAAALAKDRHEWSIVELDKRERERRAAEAAAAAAAPAPAAQGKPRFGPVTERRGAQIERAAQKGQLLRAAAERAGPPPSAAVLPGAAPKLGAAPKPALSLAERQAAQLAAAAAMGRRRTAATTAAVAAAAKAKGPQMALPSGPLPIKGAPGNQPFSGRSQSHARVPGGGGLEEKFQELCDAYVKHTNNLIDILKRKGYLPTDTKYVDIPESNESLDEMLDNLIVDVETNPVNEELENLPSAKEIMEELSGIVVKNNDKLSGKSLSDTSKIALNGKNTIQNLPLILRSLKRDNHELLDIQRVIKKRKSAPPRKPYKNTLDALLDRF